MAFHVIDEGKRCLLCKKPKCVEGCPIQTDIPKMISLFLENRLNEAGQMIFDNNPLSLVCSLVCDHEHQCEGHCILKEKSSAIHVSTIEHYISDTYFDKMSLPVFPKKNKRVAVIGSGPSGITIAFYLTQLGYDVTIFDSKDKIGGVMQYGIPEFRLPKSILYRYKNKLKEMGVKIRPNTTIGGALQIQDLLRDDYKSIFIGTGVWRPRTLKIKGESLGHVHFAIDYLANPSAYDLGEKVVIIGAGNAAMDVARTTLRHGVKNTILFERASEPVASRHEVEYAKVDGAEFECNVEVKEITEKGVYYYIHKNTESNETEEQKEELFESADSVIISISQSPKTKLIERTEGLHMKQGLLLTDYDGHTTLDGVFAAGDVVSGAKNVVEAVMYSKQVAKAMHEYMESLS